VREDIRTSANQTQFPPAWMRRFLLPSRRVRVESIQDIAPDKPTPIPPAEDIGSNEWRAAPE